MKKINNSNLKISFTLFILFIIGIVSCKKEDNVDLSLINEVVGTYDGDYNSEGEWRSYGPTITKSDDSTLLINYWPTGPHHIKLKINGNNLKIEKQIFDLENHSLAQGHLYNYQLRLSANGSFKNDTITMTFKEEIKIEGESDFKHKTSGNISIHKQ